MGFGDRIIRLAIAAELVAEYTTGKAKNIAGLGLLALAIMLTMTSTFGS